MSGRDDAFAAANPRLEVPALVDGDTRVFDSTIILEYIEDRWPTPPLLPAAPAERARVRMLEEVCDTYVEPISWAAMEIRVFKRATGALAERLLARGAEQAAGVQRYLERQLADRPWFNGAAFGWGDLSVVPYVRGIASTGTPPPAGTHLAAWFERVRPRPRACRASRCSRSSSSPGSSSASTATTASSGWSAAGGSTSCSTACAGATSASAWSSPEAAVAAPYLFSGVARRPASCYRRAKSICQGGGHFVHGFHRQSVLRDHRGGAACGSPRCRPRRTRASRHGPGHRQAARLRVRAVHRRGPRRRRHPALRRLRAARAAPACERRRRQAAAAGAAAAERRERTAAGELRSRGVRRRRRRPPVPPHRRQPARAPRSQAKPPLAAALPRAGIGATRPSSL